MVEMVRDKNLYIEDTVSRIRQIIEEVYVSGWQDGHDHVIKKANAVIAAMKEEKTGETHE